MTRKAFSLLFAAILVVSLVSMVGAQEPEEPQAPARARHQHERAPRLPEDGREPAAGRATAAPIRGSASWYDTFDNDVGFSYMYNSVALDSDLKLTQIEALSWADQGGDILASAAGSNGKIYVGTSGAYLNVYNPGTGTMTGLGAPVPDECFG